MLSWGEDLLDAAAAGRDPAEAVAALARADNQLALVDAAGRVGVHTGAACEAHAGHISGIGGAAQANLAARPGAWEAMLSVFDTTAGPLAERLVAALAASGGDRRGQQAAAVVVTGGAPGQEMTGFWWEPHVDLRVDDHRAPVAELDRLLRLHRAHCEMRRVLAETDLEPDDRLAVLEPLLTAHPEDPHLNRAVQSARSNQQERSRPGDLSDPRRRRRTRSRGPSAERR